MIALRSTIFAASIGLTIGSAIAQDITLSVARDAGELEDRLRNSSLLLRETDEPRTAQDFIAAARADYSRLVAALYDAGYFSPVVRISIDGVEAARIPPFGAPHSISDIQISVDPGSPYQLREAEIGPLAEDTTLPDEFRTGGQASTALLRDTTRAAIGRWREVGHAGAEIAGQQIRADAREAVLDVRIRLDPGNIVRFGTLNPDGHERMRTERIIAIAGLPEGEVFSPETLDRVEQRLIQSGVFSGVALQEGEIRSDDTMDIDLSLVESPPRRLGFGAEVSTDDGASLSAYWLHRNLFGGAERLRIEGEISGIGTGELSDGAADGIDAGLDVRYSRPATFTPDTTLYGALFGDYIDDPAFSLTSIGLETGIEHQFTPRLNGAVGLRAEYFDIDDAFGDRQVTILSAPARLTWDRREDPLDARRLFFVEAAVTPFITDNGNAGARAFVDARYYLGLNEGGRSRLAGRVQAGSVVGAEITEIPPSFLFFSGGAGTVRGQEYQSLGAIHQGQDAGGRSFLGLSTEFRQDIGETNFGLVAFADAGLIGSEADGSDADWHAGAGLGLRYATPFGPIRVDLATPVRGQSVGEDIYLYIGIGHAF